MKIYIVMFDDGYESKVEGVYSSLEAAEVARKTIIDDIEEIAPDYQVREFEVK